MQAIANADLNSVYFTSAKTGYAVGVGGTSGDSGIILKTINGGTSWSEQNAGLNNLLYSVYFSDSLTGYAVGINASDSGLILKTSDAGKSWVTQKSITSGYTLTSVFFTMDGTGYIAGSLNSGQSGVILKLSKGSTTWTLQNTTHDNLYSVFFIDSLTGYTAGVDNGNFAGIVLQTLNEGLSLSSPQTINGLAFALRSVFFTDSLTGYAVGKGTILSTSDAGTLWNDATSFDMLNSVFFISANTGYMVGSTDTQGLDGIILQTVNAGASWSTVASGSKLSGLNSVFFPDSATGFAVGNGVIARTGTGTNMTVNPER